MKLLKRVRERVSRHALPKMKIDLSLAKAEFEDWFDKAIDKIFFNDRFETFLNSCVILSAFYFLGHIVLAFVKGWPF